MIGIRYKCSVCRDFELCDICEPDHDHPHPFLKIKNPEQYTEKIIELPHK
jgi:hypothetical protein